MSALKEFANLITLNMADLAATYARLLGESDTVYEALSLESRIASGRKLLRAASQACLQQTSEPLSQFLNDNPLHENQQPAYLITQLECLGNTLTPAVPNLDAGKFLWQILATVRSQLLKVQFESSMPSPEVGSKPTNGLASTPSQANMQHHELEERVRFLSYLVESSQVAQVALDETGIIQYVNPYFCTLYGYSADEVFSQHVSILIAHEGPEQHYQEYLAAVQEQDVWRGEENRKRKDGSIFPASVSFSQIRDETGQVVAYLDVSRDITDRHDANSKLRQAEQALRDSEERFRRLSEASFEAIAISESGLILDVNEEFTRLYGYSRDEVIGMHAMQVVPAEWQDVVRQKIMSGDEVPYNAFNRRKDGTTFPAQIVGKTIPYQDRMVRVTAIRDITAQTAIEEQLRQRQQEQQIILDSVPAAIWFKDTKNRILRVNQRAAALMGLSIGEIEGKTLSELNKVEAEAHHQDELEVINSGQPKLGTVEPITMETGEIRWLQTDKIPYRNETGEIAGIVVFSLDITERRKAEDELQITQFTLDKVGLDVVWAGSEAQLMYVNDTACNNLGYSRQELLTMSIYDINPALTPEMWAAHWEEIKQRKTFTFDTYHQRRNGEMYPVDISVNYIEFEGQPYNCTIWRDITEQVRAEQQIKESLERRTQQIEISTEIAQEIAAAPGLTRLFQRVVDLVQARFGYYHVHLYTVERHPAGKDTLIVREGSGEAGQKLKVDGHSIALSAEKSLVARSARSGEAVLAEDVSLEEGWLPNPLLPNTKSELAVPIKLRDEVLGVLDVQSDILAGLGQEDQLLLMGLCGQIAVAVDTRRAEEERTIAQASLRETEERMRELVNDLPVGIYRNTPGKAGHFIEANPAIITLFEAGSTAEFMKHSVSDWYRNPEDWQHFSDKMLQHGYLRGEELALITLKGREIWGAITAVMKTDAAGQIYFDGMIEDITERKRVQDDLEKALAEAQILQQLAQTLAGVLEVDDVANAFFAAVRQLLDVDFAIFSLVDKQRQRVVAISGFNISADHLRLANHSLTSDDIMADIIRTGQTELITGLDPRFDPEIVALEGMETWGLRIFTPITLRQEHIGLVEVGFKEQIEGTIQEHHVGLIRTLLDQVAVSIDNVLRYQANRRIVRREQTIREITDKMRAASSLEDLAKTTAQELGRCFSAKYALVDFGIDNSTFSAGNGESTSNIDAS